MKLTLTKTYVKEFMISKTKSKREEVYTYEGEGVKLTFHARPTRAWVWEVIRMESNPEGERLKTKIINAFVKTMMTNPGVVPGVLTVD